MKLSNRQNEIVGILRKQGYAKVEELAERTYISPSSVRRDLQYMETLGIVERDYGGVKLKGQEQKNPPIRVRKGKDRLPKKAIAAEAAKLLRNNCTVLLDSSTTVFYLVEHLAKFKNITVLTNNLETAMACIESGLTVYVIGGRSIRGMPVVGGAYAEEMLSKVHADMVFLSSYGLDENGIISDPSEEENRMRKQMMRCADVRVLMMDQGKLGRSSLHILGSVREMDHVIINDPEAAAHYQAMTGQKEEAN